MNILAVAKELGVKPGEVIVKARELGMPHGTRSFSKVPADIAGKLLGRDVAPDPRPAPPPEVEPGDNLPTLSDMVEWVCSQIPDPNECPFCAFAPILEEGLKKHLKERHDVKVMAWFVNPTAGPDAYAQMMRQPEGVKDDYPPPPEPGFDVAEDNIDPSFNHVPASIQKKLRASGAYGRWVAPRNIRRYWDLGYRFQERPQGEGEDELHYQENTADGRMRAREYVYMTLPRERRQQIDAIKRRRVEESEEKLPASIERKKFVLGDPGKQTYDWHHARGMRHENAMVLAKQAERQGRPILTGPPPKNPHVHQRQGTA